MIIDYCKNLTPRAAEPKHSLHSLSFVHLTFFEVAVAFRCPFAAASCFRKLQHFLWCSLRPVGVIALNLSWQSLHRCINRMNKNNDEKTMAICSLGRPRGCFAMDKKIWQLKVKTQMGCQDPPQHGNLCPGTLILFWALEPPHASQGTKWGHCCSIDIEILMTEYWRFR